MSDGKIRHQDHEHLVADCVINLSFTDFMSHAFSCMNYQICSTGIYSFAILVPVPFL